MTTVEAKKLADDMIETLNLPHSDQAYLAGVMLKAFDSGIEHAALILQGRIDELEHVEKYRPLGLPPSRINQHALTELGAMLYRIRATKRDE